MAGNGNASRLAPGVVPLELDCGCKSWDDDLGTPPEIRDDHPALELHPCRNSTRSVRPWLRLQDDILLLEPTPRHGLEQPPVKRSPTSLMISMLLDFSGPSILPPQPRPPNGPQYSTPTPFLSPTCSCPTASMAFR